MSARDSILVTGGAGFVGSHFARLAAESGSRVVVLDDRSDWPDLPADIACCSGDVGDRLLVRRLLADHRVTAVVHFAGKICVGESIERPELYYEQNVSRSLALLDVVRASDTRAFVFSSSAAVYGSPEVVPIVETARYAPVNPYGATKLAIEHALASYGRAHGIRWAALRYFNAAGAHPDGTMAERHDPETHLLPRAIDAALGRGAPIDVYGGDYPTRDGTCERDYVHVCDLARAHLSALDVLDRADVGSINLGSGRGHTVREVISACARVIGNEVPHFEAPRREGDPAVLVASSSRARQVLGWEPDRVDLGTIIEDVVRSRTAR